MESALIIYFSRAGENYVSGTLQYLKKGNTEIAAETIQKLTGGKLFKVQPWYRTRRITIRALRKHTRTRKRMRDLGLRPCRTIWNNMM